MIQSLYYKDLYFKLVWSTNCPSDSNSYNELKGQMSIFPCNLGQLYVKLHGKVCNRCYIFKGQCMIKFLQFSTSQAVQRLQSLKMMLKCLSMFMMFSDIYFGKVSPAVRIVWCCCPCDYNTLFILGFHERVSNEPKEIWGIFFFQKGVFWMQN